MPTADAASLQDVADASGVSRGTASRALSGTGRVSTATRARVLAAAAELDYATNVGARNLRRARAGSIGLWLPRDVRFAEYYMHFTWGVVDGIGGQELTVSLIPGDFPPERAHSLHVDGFVMADVDGHDELARAILDGRRPVVTSELVPRDLPQPSASVAADHRAETIALLDRLRAGGSTRIAMLTPDADQTWVHEIDTAAAAWSTQSGTDVMVVSLHGIQEAAELERLVGETLARMPDVDAIVCVAEGIAVGVLSVLRSFGRAVPGDIQLVSYVDSPAMSIVQPPISALDLRPREAGRRAGEILVSLLAESHAAPRADTRVEPFALVYRDRDSTRGAR